MSEQDGNKHGDTYSAHNIEAGQGCWEVLYRLNYSDGIAVNYDDVKWQKEDEKYFRATIGTSSVKVHTYSKQALETSISYCQRFKATHAVSRIIYEMLPWFISHQAIWFTDLPKEAEQVAIYTTPPTAMDEIKNGVSIHYFIAEMAAALFYKPNTAKFVDQWGRSGMRFKAMLQPSPDILTPSELSAIQRDIKNERY